MKTIRVGVYGAGVVAGGVIDILRRKSVDYLSHGIRFELNAICCQDLSKKRDFTIPVGVKLTTDVAHIVNDPSIDMVVEVMGGTTHAYDVAILAARNGKHLVTANKALLAARLDEISEAFGKGGSRLGYEASVAGGIPIIRSMQTALLPDEITEISGILNGTCNFILSRMEATGEAFHVALKKAQDAGYAETDPTADVEGYDARNKLAILMKLGWGLTTQTDTIATTSIIAVTDTDFRICKSAGATIRQVGRAKRVDQGLHSYVCPTVVPIHSSLGTTVGADNHVSVHSEHLGCTSYKGPGAGRYATANSIIADMLAISKGEQPKCPFPRPACRDLQLQHDFITHTYIRAKFLASHDLHALGIGDDIVPIGSSESDRFAAYLTKKPASYAKMKAICQSLVNQGKITELLVLPAQLPEP